MAFQKLPSGPNPIRLGLDEAIWPRSQSLTEGVQLDGSHIATFTCDTFSANYADVLLAENFSCAT